MRGKLCPARELQGPSMAQSMQPGGGHDEEDDDDHDDDDGDDEQSDLFS